MGVPAICAVDPWPALRPLRSFVALLSRWPLRPDVATRAGVALLSTLAARPGFALRSSVAIASVLAICAGRACITLIAFGAWRSVSASGPAFASGAGVSSWPRLHGALLCLARLAQRLGGERSNS